jgi:GMP synthase (glutamine-hydrolysing)
MPKVLILQHVACETPGTIWSVLEHAGIAVQIVRSFEEQTVPEELGDCQGLIVMGGPMGVYEQDKYHFLREEIRLIEQALERKTPVLGVCLGSQLLASVLGSAVRPGKSKEIGWHAVTLTDAASKDPLWHGLSETFTGLHWHGDIFDVPNGAVSLASSDLTACQAYRYGDFAYGLLFHLEITESMIREWLSVFAEELEDAAISNLPILEGINQHQSALQEIGQTVFRRWTNLVISRSVQ